MTYRKLFGWILALCIAGPIDAVTAAPIDAVTAAPIDCLALRANADIASCANRYEPGAPNVRGRSAHDPAPAAMQQVRGNDSSDLIALPVLPPRAPAPPPEPERLQTYAVERSGLVNIVAASVGGSIVLILAALGIWRLVAANSKACPYCGAKMSRGATSCRHCFRAA